MGIERTVFLGDEFDWDYGNSTKSAVLSILEKSYNVMASFNYWIVVDIDRQSIDDFNEYLLDNKVPYDCMYIQRNNDPYLVPEDI